MGKDNEIIIIDVSSIKKEPDLTVVHSTENHNNKCDSQQLNGEHESDMNFTNICDNTTLDEEDEDSLDYAETQAVFHFKKDVHLIEVYKSMPILYDRHHPNYKYNSKKEKAWKEISKITNMSTEACKKRMTYFRARFSAERRVTKNGVPASEWPLMEKLKFLHKYIRLRKARDTIEVEDEEEDEIGTTDSKNQSYQPYFIRKRPQENDDSLAPSKLVITKRRPSDERDENLQQSVSYNGINNSYLESTMITSPSRDEHSIFGEYVTQVLRKLPQNTAPLTTLKIMKVLVDAQSENGVKV